MRIEERTSTTKKLADAYQPPQPPRDDRELQKLIRARQEAERVKREQAAREAGALQEKVTERHGFVPPDPYKVNWQEPSLTWGNIPPRRTTLPAGPLYHTIEKAREGDIWGPWGPLFVQTESTDSITGATGPQWRLNINALLGATGAGAS